MTCGCSYVTMLILPTHQYLLSLNLILHPFNRMSHAIEMACPTKLSNEILCHENSSHKNNLSLFTTGCSSHVPDNGESF